MTDPELVEAAIAASGLSSRQFARRLAWRNERQARRWTSGEASLSPEVREGLQRFLALTEPQRRAVVQAALTEPEG